MTVLIADRVAVTTTSVGIGSVALGAAVASYRSFAVAFPDGEVYYGILDEATAEWEIGLGTLSSSGTVLSRDTVYSSSNGGSKINFQVGQKIVYAPIPAAALNTPGMADGSAPAPGLPFKADMDTGFYRPAANVLGIATFGKHRMTVMDNGTVRIGDSAILSGVAVSDGRALEITQAEVTSGTSDLVRIIATPSGGNALNIWRYNNLSALGPTMLFLRTRGATVDQNAPVQAGDILGNVVFRAADGSTASGGSIGSYTAIDMYATVTGTPTVGDVRAQLDFRTAIGPGTYAIAARIANGQVQLSNGTEALPALSFYNQVSTGIFKASGVSGIQFGVLASEKGRFDSYGLKLGIAAGLSALENIPFSVTGSGTGNSASLSLNRYSADTGGFAMNFVKSRGAAYADLTPVVSGDVLGQIMFRGADSAIRNLTGAYLSASVDGTVSAGVLPSRWDFYGTPASGGLIRRLTIRADGTVGIGTAAPSTTLHVAGPIRKGNYTVATLPSAVTAGSGAQVFVTDAPGGANVAESDGTNWFYLGGSAVGFPKGISLAGKSVDTDAVTSGIYTGYGGLATSPSTGTNPYPNVNGIFSLFVQKMSGTLDGEYIVQTATIIYPGLPTEARTKMRIKATAALGWTPWVNQHSTEGQQDGSATLPPYTFKQETNTGLFRAAAGALAASVLGLEQMRILTDKVRFGSATEYPNINARIRSSGVTNAGSGIAAVRFSADALATYLTLGKSRGAVTDAQGAVVADDILGGILASGSDGASFQNSAFIRFIVDAPVSSGVVPSATAFIGSRTSTLQELARITSAGDMGIGVSIPTAKLHVNGPLRTASYTVATLPSASAVGAGGIAYCANAPGGPTHVTSNGTNWLIMGTQTIVA